MVMSAPRARLPTTATRSIAPVTPTASPLLEMYPRFFAAKSAAPASKAAPMPIWM